jgi:hypothetical protein
VFEALAISEISCPMVRIKLFLLRGAEEEYMGKSLDRTMPSARKEGLIVQELSDELLVWNHCDGQTAATETVLATICGRDADASTSPVNDAPGLVQATLSAIALFKSARWLKQDSHQP